MKIEITQKKFAVDILLEDQNDHSKSFTVYAKNIDEAKKIALLRRLKDGFSGRMKIHMLDNLGQKMPDMELRFDLMLKGNSRQQTIAIVD